VLDVAFESLSLMKPGKFDLLFAETGITGCPLSSKVIPKLKPMLVRISLISFRDLRPKFLVFSISDSVFCTNSPMVLMLAFFRQL
jgi:hypothetical protein